MWKKDFLFSIVYILKQQLSILKDLLLDLLTQNISLSIKTKTKIKYSKADFDSYYTAFLNGKIYRECCYECKYSNLDRVGDITLGDLWGIEQFDYEFYDKNGVSLAIINTEKGEELFRKIENKVEYRLYNEDNVTKFNGNLRQPTLRPQTRDVIYKELDKLSFSFDHFNLYSNPL